MDCLQNKILRIILRLTKLKTIFNKVLYYILYKFIFYMLDVSVLTLFLLLQEYELYNSFLLVIGFFMTPQIIHNIRLGTNPKFIPEYIFGFLSINVAVPVNLFNNLVIF